ncbi:MAG: FtsQ-type POTRA domain-containing protein [Candidatus Eisenbacteria bacterium]|nr:FtsQ-type POTRA domain-containing protein [Candidatus Eisenbacteria bacterium]
MAHAAVGHAERRLHLPEPAGRRGREAHRRGGAQGTSGRRSRRVRPPCELHRERPRRLGRGRRGAHRDRPAPGRGARRCIARTRGRRHRSSAADRREVAVSAARARLGRILILAAAGLLAAGIGYAVYAARSWGEESGRFVLEGIEVEGNTVLTSDEVITLAGVQRGASLLDVDIREVERAVAAHSRVTRARASRRLPDRLTICLTERRPAALVADGHGGWVEVTSDGTVLPTVERTDVVDLPVVTGVKAPAVGVAAGEELTAALRVLERAWEVAPELWMDISEIRIAPGSGLTIYTVADGAEVRVGLGALTRSDLKRLWLVLADAGARGRRVEQVDLRYDRQVIVRFADGQPERGV